MLTAATSSHVPRRAPSQRLRNASVADLAALLMCSLPARFSGIFFQKFSAVEIRPQLHADQRCREARQDGQTLGRHLTIKYHCQLPGKSKGCANLHTLVSGQRPGWQAVDQTPPGSDVTFRAATSARGTASTTRELAEVGRRIVAAEIEGGRVGPVPPCARPPDHLMERSTGV
jgi:hypothetical protein